MNRNGIRRENLNEEINILSREINFKLSKPWSVTSLFSLLKNIYHQRNSSGYLILVEERYDQRRFLKIWFERQEYMGATAKAQRKLWFAYSKVQRILQKKTGFSRIHSDGCFSRHNKRSTKNETIFVDGVFGCVYVLFSFTLRRWPKCSDSNNVPETSTAK